MDSEQFDGMDSEQFDGMDSEQFCLLACASVSVYWDTGDAAHGAVWAVAAGLCSLEPRHAPLQAPTLLSRCSWAPLGLARGGWC